MSVSVARSQPQLFETNHDPDAVFSSALMEVHRIKIPNDTAVADAEKAWEAFTSTVVKASDATEIHLLSGTSVNLEEKTFVGMIGWKSNEVNQNEIHRENYLLNSTDQRGDPQGHFCSVKQNRTARPHGCNEFLGRLEGLDIKTREFYESRKKT